MQCYPQLSWFYHISSPPLIPFFNLISENIYDHRVIIKIVLNIWLAAILVWFGLVDFYINSPLPLIGDHFGLIWFWCIFTQIPWLEAIFVGFVLVDFCLICLVDSGLIWFGFYTNVPLPLRVRRVASTPVNWLVCGCKVLMLSWNMGVYG